MSFSLDATAAQLVALDKGTSDAMKMVDAQKVAGLGATLVLSADKPLGQLMKTQEGSQGQLPTGVDAALEVHAGNQKPLLELRVVNQVDYVRVDVAALAALSDDPSDAASVSQMQQEIGSMPPEYAALKALLSDKWVSVDPKQLEQLGKQLQGKAGSGASGLPSGLPTAVPTLAAGTEQKLTQALTQVFQRDVTLTDKGSSDGQDHIVVSAPAGKLETDLTQVLTPIVKEIPGLSEALAKGSAGSSSDSSSDSSAAAPNKNISADLYIGSDGSLSKVAFDFWQLNPDGKPGEHLPLSLAFNDRAPAPTVPAGATALQPSVLQSLITSMTADGADGATGGDNS